MTSPRWRRLANRPFDRRAFIHRMTVLSAAAWATPLWLPGYREAAARTQRTATNAAGTTLERSIVTTGEGPYFSLAYGPGWPQVVRAELAEPKRGREDRRVALTSVVHVTDFQFPDAQSPARVEWLARYADEPVPSFLSSAFRPQEATVVHACEAMNRQYNALAAGPVTGRRFDCTVSTGDNFDNKQANELRWFLTLMDGGELAANSGADDEFEGVQSFDSSEYYDPHYYHPEPVDDPRAPDLYKETYGYPDYPGLLDAAIRPFRAAGVRTPWYSVYGNHDALVQGNEQPNPFYESVATGGVKVLHPPPGYSPGDFWRGLVNGDPGVIADFSLAPSRPVTPDAERHFVSGREYVEAHLASPGSPGPRGHGFTEDNLDRGTLYYTFEVAPGIRGITLDTTSPRTAEGSIGETQLAWLEDRLVESHSRHYDTAGTEVATGHDDELVIVFGHHRAESMQPVQGPDEEGRVERRHGGDAVEEVLHRFPNVIAWVNGHSHFNRVVARPDPAGRTGGYWDITTAAQIDPPQQARVLEVADNQDGTLSIFTTVVDHAAGPQTAAGAYDVLGLAAISRELGFNDYQTDLETMIGEPEDLNTELLLDAPFEVAAAPPPERDQQPAPGDADDGRAPLPTTGAGLGVAAVGTALAGAIALRGRGRRDGGG